MRWVTGDERGGVAVMVAVLLVAIFGMTALVIDIGSLFHERRQLQNGADAGALAIAEDCARGLPSCALSVVGGTAKTYADENAEDDVSKVDGVDLDLAAREVTVRLRTELPGGANAIAHWFAPVIGISDSPVLADATAVWGYIGGATTLPVTFSVCEFEQYVDITTGAGFEEPDPTTGEYPSGRGHTILFHQGSSFSGSTTEDCTGTAGQDYAGGFGWLDSNDCSTSTDDGAWTDGSTGVGTPDSKVGCDSTYLNDDVWKNVVLIPVYDATNDLNGTNAQYHIAGYAGFYVTGYRFSGGPEWTRADYPGTPCHPSDRCITGYFTRWISADAFDLDGSNYGTLGYKLTG